MSNPQNPGGEPPKPLATTVADERVSHQVGALIGPYKLMEEIGEGGFGLVFVAEQQSPVKRKVALKLIKPGMDSREVIARFEAERQALALMDHPNIARVLDAGATDSGRPYFVMELVRGVPITVYCDQTRLTLRERLGLFISVCQAVQHAHQKGIIHRDIKPSNVLTTLHDGRPVVKVIDFGVAKALHQQLTDKTIYTRYTQVIGTPLYMSPEQAEMSGIDIDTRSDIYSLGVLLYELLTGTTPFDSKRLSKVAYNEFIRIIRHEEPPKPSTRLRQSSNTLPSIAAQRRIEPAKLSKMFRGDLDWITMKALEKDRTRRYESASGLAADVWRYLHDEPVEASPPSTAYRLKKFGRRYRTILATGTAFIAILLTGVVASTWFAIRENSARALAEQLRQKAEDERQRADENAQSASTEAQHARLAQHAAETEKQRALAAESKAVAAQRAEAAERRNAQAALDRSEKSLYLNRIALTERNWQANNPKRAGEILDACPPKFRDWEWHYLYRLVHAEEMILSGDNAAYSPDGELLATSDNGKDEAVRIRDARSGTIRMSLQGGHPIPFLQSLVFSPDSRRLAAVCQDGAIRIWNLPGGRQTLNVPVRLSQETIKNPLGHPVGLAFSPDGKRIALAGVASEKPNQAGILADNLVVWDVLTGKELFKVPDTGRSVAFSPDGKRLATSICDFVKVGSAMAGPLTEGMRILEADTGRVLTQFAPWRPAGFSPSHPLLGVDDCHITYSPDGKWLASARRGEIKIWDASSATEVRTLRGHTGAVTSLSFSADSQRLASASRDETVRIWDPRQAETLVVYRGHVGTVAGVSFRPDAKLIASTGEDRTVRIWSATAELGPRDIPGTGTVTGSIGLGPDGRYIAGLQFGENLRLPGSQFGLVLVDASTGRLVRLLRSFLPTVNSVHASLAFSSDGRLLASALEKEVQLWDVATGQERAHFAGLSDYERRGLAFSPDGARIAFTAPENYVEVWDIHDHKRITNYKRHRGPVTTIAFSPLGERVASGSTDETVQVWDAANGREIRKLKGTTAVEASVVFSPDGKYLLASSPDNAVRVWDLEKGTEVRAIRGHKSSVWSIAFNPTGTRLVTSGLDRVLRIWTWPECEEVLSLPPVQVAPVFVGFIADGEKLAAAGPNGVTVWNAAVTPSTGNPKD
jgi:WD40 repeat protein/serine/threonine protein kinase